MNKNNDLLYLIEVLPQFKKFKEDMFRKTFEYQNKYGFHIGSGEHSTWNNEADAFKHTFMQARTTVIYGASISKIFADLHERNGNKYYSQSKGEENMDKWNNAIGREIGEEIKKEIKNKNYNDEQIDELIAKKVMERMRAGKLITHPSDKRKYTGFAANIDGADIPDGKIFTAEEIGKLSSEDFEKFEKYIDNQLKEFGVPRENQAQNMLSTGELICVNDYTRDDGTPVKGYYRRK